MSCNDKNSLTREGTSLFNRVLSALSTDYAKVDERQYADLILFAKKYASYLNYFDSTNNPVSDWEPIMKMDASVALAELLKLNCKKIFTYRLYLYKQISLASTAATDADQKTKDQFKLLFDFIFSLVKFIDEQYRLIPPDLNKKEVLHGTIRNKMAEALSNLVSLFNTLSTGPLNLIDINSLAIDESIIPIKVSSCKNFDATTLDEAWVNDPPLSYLITDSITFPAKTISFTEKDQLIWLINHNLFNAQIDSLFKGITFLVTLAEEIFNQVISDYPKHSPHYTLFLSFIKLFRFAQDDLNRFTQRHLDFYYKDILQLENKNPLPDSAFLLFELQKPVYQHLLKKDSLFKGGKDISGKEINYALSEDIVLNKAIVAKLQSRQMVAVTGKNVLKSAVIANSDDGVSAKISTADKSWFTFGDTDKINNANTGFGIVSNMLLLNEGEREITIAIDFINPSKKLLFTPYRYTYNCFSGKLTGKKGWLDVAIKTVSSFGNRLVFTCKLEASDPAIVAYDEKLHKSNLHFTLPVLQLYFKQDASNAIPYQSLCKKSISSINISVKVTGVKDLQLSHDSGTIDGAKPFKPFGEFPGDDSAFYIGSNEIFQKQLSSIHLAFDWKKKPTSSLKNASYLTAGIWKTATLSGDDINFSSTDPFINAPVSLEKNTPLQSASLNGFLRLRNSTDFSYKQYLIDVSNALTGTTFVKSAGNTYTLNVGAMPPASEIILNSFSIDYEASVYIDLQERDPLNNIFFHFTDFGYAEVHPSLIDTSAETGSPKRITVLPDIIHSGELFIGFEGAKPTLVINVLFQLADGSANPLKKTEPVTWYYLAENNNWKKFDNSQIIDSTSNFTQSAIVTITLPEDISDDNTAFSKGLYWIKAVVKENTDAVCKTILIQSQAAQVTIVQDDNRQIEFRKKLPAKTISKLVISDAAIKTITQPFDSFDGRVREPDEHFYVRVSERLRHKKRAITIWDYEHMVIEQFPDIFKVKCLNNTGIAIEKGKEVFCENYPGHVTIIPICNQQNMLNVNPLKPYTSLGMLNKITDFLKAADSPFVKLEVLNPQFEEIQLDFKVKFYDHLDESFYENLLNDEIERFLCPWAFDQQKDIDFGGRIVKSVLLNFVEERPYVDYVTCFKMNHIIERKGSVHILEKQDVEEAIPSTSRSLLVSYFDEKTKSRHNIIPGTCC